MKKSGLIAIALILSMMFLVSFASASWFSNFFGKFTGNVVATDINSGLVAYYPFDYDASDYVGIGLNGTNNGAVLVPGKKGNAYSFNGVNNYIDVGNSNLFNSNTMTVGAWIKTSDSKFQSVFSRDTSGGRSYYLGLVGGYMACQINGQGGCDSKTAYVNDGAWHYVTYVGSSGSWAFYVDGVLIYNKNMYSNPTITSTKNYIGNRGWNDAYFNGVIDEVRFYNKALSASEVSALYNSYGNGSNQTIACYQDSDCGISNTTSYCNANGSACTISTSYSCNHAGTPQSFCSSTGSAGCGPVCPNGCLNGACVTSIPTPTCSENYQLKAEVLDANSVIIYRLVGNSSYVQCNNLQIGQDCYINNLSLQVVSIDDQFDSMTLSVNSPSVFDYIYTDERSYRVINSSQMFYADSDRSFGVSYCGNISSSQVCQSLIDGIKTPANIFDGRGEWQLNYNQTYRSDSWINQNLENYTGYSASWSTYDGSNYSHLYLEIEVYDNPKVDLSSNFNWMASNPICKIDSFWVNNKENKYYICNWDAIRNNQDLDDATTSTRDLYWYNNNVRVGLYVYSGKPLSPSELNTLTQLRVNELIDNLKDNNYVSVDWTNFQLSSELNSFVYNNLNDCESTISSNTSTLNWACKMEPVICPPHGYQNQICRAWDSDQNKEVVSQNQLSCSPGMCSGCYTPKWLGGSDNKCIPYGFRFELQSGHTDRIYETTDILQKIIIPNGFDVSFEIRADGNAYITINSDIDLSNLSSDIVSFSYLIDGVNYTGRAGETLIITPGVHTLDATYYDANGIKISSDRAEIEISDIHYDAIASKRYIEIKHRYNNPSYCDIDGWVKVQQPSSSKCQNNYECESNFCSSGDCVDVKGELAQAGLFRSWMVKAICKLSNLFNSDEYLRCVASYI